ncbi:outer membrane protein [Paracoccus methylarcula]|nr:outer membrane beta-barrel protein [Paracoccus methylarcula]
MRGKFLATVCAVSSVTTLISGVAYAGGFVAPVIEPTPVVVEPTPVSDWAGAYVGGSLGYVLGSDDSVGFENSDTGARDTDLGDLDLKGVNAGLHAGYRWQKDKWVFGPELGIEGGSVDASENISPFGTDSEIESELNYLVSLRMKTGYEVSPNTLVYGTFGVAHGDFDYTLSDASSSQTKGFSDTGVAAGLGVERKLNENLSMFAEWEYRHFGKTDVAFDTDAGTLSTRATPKHHNVKVGVNYRF